MATVISGDGTITGLTATGISAVQQLPAGSVIQTINATYSTQVSNSTSTYADTGLTASITPKFATSKILVLISQNGCAKTSANTENRILLQLLRDVTTISVFSGDLGLYTGTALTINGNMSWGYLDSPATTSSVTYKTRFLNNQNTAAVIVQYGSANSSITLLEIAA